MNSRIVGLEQSLASVRADTMARATELTEQLQAARTEIAVLQEMKADLQKQVEEETKKLLDVQKKIAHATSDAYRPEALAEQLRHMMADGTIVGVLEMLDSEDKLAFFRLLLNSCDVAAKHNLMQTLFKSCSGLHKLDMGLVATSLRMFDKEHQLQALLKVRTSMPSHPFEAHCMACTVQLKPSSDVQEFEHDPALILEQLSDSSEGDKAKVRYQPLMQ